MRKIEIRNTINGSGTWFELELTNDDIKKLDYNLGLIGVNIKVNKELK